MEKSILIFFVFICFLVIAPRIGIASAEGITYDKKRCLLSVHADGTIGLMAVLQDLENKTGIKVTLSGGISDRYVTIDMEQLPIKKIGELLEALNLNNTALILDNEDDVSEIIILPEGKGITHPYYTRGYPRVR